MRKLFRYVLVLLSLTLVAGAFVYFTYRADRTAKSKRVGLSNRSFLLSLPAKEDFSDMQGEPLSGKFSDVHTVKIVLDIKENKLYYINSTRFRYHYDFCNEVLGAGYDINTFNTINYGLRDRDFLLGNINYYAQSGMYTLELSTEDRMSADFLQRLYDAVQATSFLGKHLKVQLSSDHLAGLFSSGAISVPSVTPTEVYGKQTYQPLRQGEAYGYIRIVNDLQEEYSNIGPTDIIIIKGTPVRIPVCAGIITNSLQTPLSHINVLCHNRNIISAADVRIFEKEWITNFNGKPVVISVRADSISLRETSAEVIAEVHKRDSNSKLVKLRYNTKMSGLLSIADIGEREAQAVGNKAVGLGHLYRISRKGRSKFFIPEGCFAIPFFYYQQHLNHPGVKRELDILLSAPRLSDVQVKEQLKRIRQAIKAAPLDPDLLSMVEKRMIAYKVGNAYRFRSSSNAEDARGFSGAGLYDSKTGVLNDTAKSVADAIRKVWASAWNEEAYRERDYFNIDQRTIMMGIVAHRSFPDEVANGVVVTRNLYRQGFPGYLVNVQLGEVSVVAPQEGVVCEQYLSMDADVIDPLNPNVTAEYITHSSIASGKPVLTMEQVSLLHQQVRLIHHDMYYRAGNHGLPEFDDYALDIEFKFSREGKLYIKQVRPYK